MRWLAAYLGYGAEGNLDSTGEKLSAAGNAKRGRKSGRIGNGLRDPSVGKHKVEGVGVSFIPKTFHCEFCDRIAAVSDDAFTMVKRLAAAQLALELGPGKRIALIIPDSAERYLSKNIFAGGA